MLALDVIQSSTCYLILSIQLQHSLKVCDFVFAQAMGVAPTCHLQMEFDRILRLGLGLALLFLAYNGGFSGLYLVAGFAGGLVMFSAVHDRCPAWQAIKGFLSAKTKPAG